VRDERYDTAVFCTIAYPSILGYYIYCSGMRFC